MGVKVKLTKSLCYLIHIKGRKTYRFKVKRKVKVGHDGSNLTTDKGSITILNEVLQLFAFKLIEVFIDAINTAIGLQKTGRPLVSYAGNAGDIIGTITL